MSGLMEDDLEAGLGTHSDVGSLNGRFVVLFGQETADEVRPLFYNNVQFSQKSVKEENKSKIPPKPPRPPKGPALDAYDLKLISELSALALERRLRTERLKGLKKKGVSKAEASTSSSFISLIVTLLFCLIIFLQGNSFHC